MPIVTDKGSQPLQEFNLGSISKGEVGRAFDSYSEEKIIFNKKGSDIKSILYAKRNRLESTKSILLKKMSALLEALGERKGGSQEGHVDVIDNNMEYALPHDDVSEWTEEEKKTYSMYMTCRRELWDTDQDLKMVDTLIKHVDDESTYKLNVRQIHSIEKGITKGDISGASPISIL